MTLPDFPAPLARAPPDAKRPACPSPAASDDSQSDTAHFVPPYLLPPIACATRRVNARCRAAPLPLHPSAFLAVSAVPARVCPTSAPLNPAPRPALPLYRRPAPHRPPTRPRPVLPSPAPQPPCSHPRMTLPGRGDCPHHLLPAHSSHRCFAQRHLSRPRTPCYQVLRRVGVRCVCELCVSVRARFCGPLGPGAPISLAHSLLPCVHT